MTKLQILGNLLSAAVGVGFIAALLLGEPLKSRSRRESLLVGASGLGVSSAMLGNRILENPPGIWWWLGVGGMAAATVVSLAWLFMASKYWPKEQKPPRNIRFRPAALFLLLLGDGLLLEAARVEPAAGKLLLVLLALLVLLVLYAFTQLMWAKQQVN